MNESQREQAARGLNAAVKVAGSRAALARSLGVSGPAVRQWEAVPSERVLAVEGLTGVRREQLRPDIYGEPTEIESEVVLDPAIGDADPLAALSPAILKVPCGWLVRQRDGGAYLFAELTGLIQNADYAREAELGEVDRHVSDLAVIVVGGEARLHGDHLDLLCDAVASGVEVSARVVTLLFRKAEHSDFEDRLDQIERRPRPLVGEPCRVVHRLVPSSRRRAILEGQAARSEFAQLT